VANGHSRRRSRRREDGKVKNETLANLSHLPPELIELIRGTLRGESYLAAGEAFEIERSLPRNTCWRGLSMARRLDLAMLLDRKPSRERDLVIAMICERVIAPASKLSTSVQRRDLLDGLLDALRSLKGAGCVTAYLDGGLVTSKDH
jgi:hypothetical protein